MTGKPSTSKEAGAVVPVNYIHHREDTPVFKDGLPRPDNVNGGPVPSKSSPPPSYTKAARETNENEKSGLYFFFFLIVDIIYSAHLSPSISLGGADKWSFLWEEKRNEITIKSFPKRFCPSLTKKLMSL